MKTRKAFSILSLIKIIIIAAIVAFDIWVFISWLNVGFNNCSPETVKNIWSWNFFNVCFK